MERRLAAILAADMVGYSRLMAEDELDELFAQRGSPARTALMSLTGQNRKSVTATRMSAAGGRAEVDFGRLDFRV